MTINIRCTAVKNVLYGFWLQLQHPEPCCHLIGQYCPQCCGRTAVYGF